MLIKPEPYLTAAESGLNLFLYSVLPTLVPFSFITSFLSYSGGAELLFKALKKPSAILFNGSGAAGYAFSLSLLSGYPVGAKTVTELYNCGCIGREEVSKIAAFTSTTGPLFVLGTVGVKFIGESAAAIILISHIAATVLNGVLFGRGGGAKEITIAADENYFSAFSKAVGATANAALSVAVCMIVFNVGAALMNETGVLNAAGYLLEKAFLPTGGGKAFATNVVGKSSRQFRRAADHRVSDFRRRLSPYAIDVLFKRRGYEIFEIFYLETVPDDTCLCNLVFDIRFCCLIKVHKITLNEFSLPVNFFRIKKVCTGDKLFSKIYYFRSINACPIIIPLNEFSLPVNFFRIKKLVRAINSFQKLTIFDL